jgi:recombination protein RecA
MTEKKIKEVEVVKTEAEKPSKKLKVDLTKNNPMSYFEIRRKTRMEMAGKINTHYKGDVFLRGNNRFCQNVPRFSTGSLSLDYALGGGIPAQKVTNIYGAESTSKTTIMLKAMADAQKRNKVDLSYIDFNKLREQGFVYDDAAAMYKQPKTGQVVEPCYCVIVDLEGTFDAKWFTALGGDPSRLGYAMPEYGEQAVDIIDEFLSSGIIDLIGIDSLSMMTPKDELDASAEDKQMGLQARMLNKGFRKWTSRITKLKQGDHTIPTIITINQLRQKIGVMFGSPDTLPGGLGQKFAASAVIQTKKGKTYHLGEGNNAQKLVALYKEMNGEVVKNKTAPPNLEYEFNLAISDYDPDGHKGDAKYEVPFKTGNILEHKQVLSMATKFNMMGKDDKVNQFFVQLIDRPAPIFYKRKQDLLNEWIYGDDVKYRQLKHDLMRLMTKNFQC